MARLHPRQAPDHDRRRPRRVKAMKIATKILVFAASFAALEALKHLVGVPASITIAAFIVGWLMAGPGKD